MLFGNDVWSGQRGYDGLKVVPPSVVHKGTPRHGYAGVGDAADIALGTGLTIAGIVAFGALAAIYAMGFGLGTKVVSINTKEVK
jgi:hypothetical protein